MAIINFNCLAIVPGPRQTRRQRHPRPRAIRGRRLPNRSAPRRPSTSFGSQPSGARPPLRCNGMPFPDWGQPMVESHFKECCICMESGRCHPVQCRQCLQTPACCDCLQRNYQSPDCNCCPLCRYAGDVAATTASTTTTTTTTTSTSASSGNSFFQGHALYKDDSDVYITDLESSSEEEIDLPPPPYRPQPDSPSPSR